MPKLIKNAKENILAAARRQLLSEGYVGLTIRSVAAECGIATGTVYNYFPGKETLAAGVMLQDWLSDLSEMNERCLAASTLQECLRVVYEGLVGYSARFAPAWSEYAHSGGAQYMRSERHPQLIEQLSGVLRVALSRFGVDCSGFLSVFLAENLLTAALESYDFEELLAVLNKLL